MEHLFQESAHFFILEKEKASEFYQQYNHLVSVTGFYKPDASLFEIEITYKKLIFKLRYVKNHVFREMDLRDFMLVFDQRNLSLFRKDEFKDFFQLIEEKRQELETGVADSRLEQASVSTLLNHFELIESYVKKVAEHELERNKKEKIINRINSVYSSRQSSDYYLNIWNNRVSLEKLKKIKAIIEKKP